MQTVKKGLWTVAVSAVLILGGCASKSVTAEGAENEDGVAVQAGEHVNAKALKQAIVRGAQADGWMTTPLGERIVIAEKFFDEQSNVAVEVIITQDGYAIEPESAQNVSDSKVESLMEDLAEAIEKARAETQKGE